MNCLRKRQAEIFRRGVDGWDTFYQKYPGSSGIVTLSKVGFNKEMNQALVIMGVQRGRVFGIGELYLLQKENNAWRIQKAAMLWIS